MGAAILLLNVVRQYGRLPDTAEVWGRTMPPEVCRVDRFGLFLPEEKMRWGNAKIMP